MPDHQTTHLARLAAMRQFGFGPEVMKGIKVCRVCGCTCSAGARSCRECGAVLPRETLFDLYKARHLYCPACDTVVARSAIFCPQCGKRLRTGQAVPFSIKNRLFMKEK
ncbi:MAG: hypothetical protein IJC43_04785 [Clostridia bacterium]|nr:hypothetical protein [Clostridia bacterium]